MKKRYQLIIIGAGPAGSYAAMTAAKEGLDVLLVERSREVGLPLACAEAVSHDGLKRFIDPDPSFISTEINEMTLTVATGFGFSYGGSEGVGYVLDRSTFDRYLANQAVDHGAELLTGACACGIEISENKPAVISLETDNGPKTVSADYVIAADGVESMIGRMAGIETLLELSRCDANLQYRVSGIEINPHCLEFCVGEKYSSDGYLWVFPKTDHSANIGLGHNPEVNDNRDLRRRLDRFLKERYGEYTVDFESCGLVPKFIGFDVLGRDCLLLAGDAARTIDSLTGAGISRALHTGQLAAKAVVAAIGGTIPRENLVKCYRESVDEELGQELRFFNFTHKIFRKLTDEDWESLAMFLEKYLAGKKAGSLDPAQIVKSALTGAPRLARLARHLI